MYMTRRSRSTGGCDMCNVHEQWTVTSPVCVGRSMTGRSQLAAHERGLHERAVRTGDDAQLP